MKLVENWGSQRRQRILIVSVSFKDVGVDRAFRDRTDVRTEHSNLLEPRGVGEERARLRTTTKNNQSGEGLCRGTDDQTRRLNRRRNQRDSVVDVRSKTRTGTVYYLQQNSQQEMRRTLGLVVSNPHQKRIPDRLPRCGSCLRFELRTRSNNRQQAKPQARIAEDSF